MLDKWRVVYMPGSVHGSGGKDEFKPGRDEMSQFDAFATIPGSKKPRFRGWIAGGAKISPGGV